MRNNGTKYFLFLDDSCEEICKSKAFVIKATTEDNVDIQQGGLEWDDELQNTHLFLQICRDMMQVILFSAQLGHGSELGDWYPDASSVT